MPGEPTKSVEAIFAQALEQPDPALRQALIKDACESDDALLEEVTQLLAAHEKAGQFLPEQPAPRPAADSAPPELPGFRVRRQIGRGGLGAVYEAFDEKLQRTVALKVLTRGGPGDIHARILAEARKAAALRNPAIVTIYAVHDEAAAPAVSMELIEGFPVDRATVSLNFEQKARILLQIAEAIAVAHRAGIIHRDLKPENILLTPDLQAKILDFGLAISFTEAQAGRGFFEGTPRYASPEQVAGEALTSATDIFSFGGVMFKVLTGRHAFEGSSALEILESICSSDPPFLKDVAVGIPEDLQAICLACLARNPKSRPSANDVVVDLRRFLAGEPVHLRPALYSDILRQKISEYANHLLHWQHQGMISSDEKDRLETVHRRILADEDHWIIDARKISAAQTALYTSTWLVVVAAILAIWLAREQLPGPVRWAAPLFGTIWLLGAGLVSWKRREPMASASFLAAAALSLAPTVLALLNEANLLMTRPENVEQLLPTFTNAQIFAACLASFVVSALAWSRLKMTGFAWTTAILGAASYVSALLTANWLAQKPEIMALWVLPLALAELAGLACERAGRVRWALPFGIIAILALVIPIDIIAAKGPTLTMLGLTEAQFPFLNSERQNYYSLALNGYIFLGLTLLTERARSLDLRRASKILEPLALLHMLGPLFANALEQRGHPHLRIDVAVYLATAFLLLLLGPLRSSWRMLVGALGGVALGSYLLIDLGLIKSSTLTLALGIAGIAASAIISFHLLRTVKRPMEDRNGPKS